MKRRVEVERVVREVVRDVVLRDVVVREERVVVRKRDGVVVVVGGSDVVGMRSVIRSVVDAIGICGGRDRMRDVGG